MSGMDVAELVRKIALVYMPFLFALCFHEFAHGWVARRRGDNTAEMMGRLTLNPLAHVDWIGTVLLPLVSIATNSSIFFGWARPVPVNERNLKSPRTDMFWIALAGPMSNVLLATIGALISTAIARSINMDVQDTVLMLLQQFMLTNLFLAVFNMIPLHPLDGGKVLARFLPPSVNYKLEQNEATTSIVLLILMLSGALKFLVYPVIFSYQILMTIFGSLF